jgi:hypothetical protein
MLNEKEINWLIKKYESITKEQIEKASKKPKLGMFYDTIGSNSMFHLTGFSNSRKCKPCSKVDENCSLCGLNIDFKRCYNQPTYEAIDQANTVEETFDAVRARATFLRKHFPKNK